MEAVLVIMDDRDIEIALLRDLLSEAYGQLRMVEWEVNLGTLGRIEQYFEGKGIEIDH